MSVPPPQEESFPADKVSKATSAGWYVLIDNHLNLDPTAVQNRTLWLQYWARIMTAINADPISRKFVMYDIMNEPDSQGIPWVGSSGKWGMTDYYVRCPKL